jgi:hypothetical protein
LKLGSAGRTRAETDLDWRPQARAYVAVYDELTGRTGRTGTADEADDQLG